MARRSRHESPASTGRVFVAEIARELGVSEVRTRQLLHKYWWVGGQRAVGDPTYDASVIEMLRALLGQPHRQVEPPESDWLSEFDNPRRRPR